MKLSGADAATFRPIENGKGTHSYGADSKAVYFVSDLIPGADPQAFKVLWETIYEGCQKEIYSKDATHVYLGTITVPQADSATFEALLNGFGKDSRGYYKGETFFGPTLDPKELVCNYG
jgi:hypothetical protein